MTGSWLCLSDHEAEGVLEQPLQLDEEVGRVDAVGGAVIGRDRHPHQAANLYLAVARDRLWRRRTDSQNPYLGWVDYRLKVFNSPPAQVADGERSTLEV